MKNSPATSAKTSLPPREAVSARAYQIFVQRGRVHGYDMDDWLQAEYELMQLPVRKIVELASERPRGGNHSSSALVQMVHTAMILGAAMATHGAR